MKLRHAWLLGVIALASCASRNEQAVVSPDQVADFGKLYKENCAGCHNGLAVRLDDPVYLAIAGDASIRQVTAQGVAGTSMPAFAQKEGGLLTDAQIDVLVKGIRGWAKPIGVTPPPLVAASPGDPARGKAVYDEFCASCHKTNSIVDGGYLSLVSDRHLRTMVIVGNPAMGAPDWRGDVPGKPLTDAQVTDVVAWLASQRPKVQGGTQ
jgi:mono/diheme cytochrome c family protein